MNLHFRRLSLNEMENMRRMKISSSGFTLIEILVALAISGIVIAGVLSVFDNSNKSYILQEDIARMQQNVRMAKYYIEKDLRMVGYRVRNLAFDGQLIKPIVFKNNLQGDAKVYGDSDFLTISYINDDDCDCGTPPGSYRSCADLPQLLLKGEKPPSSSVAEVKEYLKGNPVPDYGWWAEACSCGGVDYKPPKPGFQALITSPDGSKSDIIFVTKVTAQTKTAGNSSLSNSPYLGYSNKQLNTYPDGSIISFFNSNSLVTIGYYIDKGNSLRRSIAGIGRKVSENIEDVQMAFCGDYNGDGSVSLAYDPANPDDAGDDWFDESNLVSGELSDTDMKKVRFIRVTILGRTSKQYRGVTNKRPGIEDHGAAIQTDGYHRRLLSFTVQIRNLGLGS